jgi:hypothetical protein
VNPNRISAGAGQQLFKTGIFMNFRLKESGRHFLFSTHQKKRRKIMKNRFKTSVLAITLLAGFCLLASGVPSAQAGWVQLGSPGFSTGAANYVKIALDSSGTPYVGYQDNSDMSAYVKTFSSGTWSTVGGTAYSPVGKGYYPSMALDSSGTPYVTYFNSSTGSLNINNLNSGSWMAFGGSITTGNPSKNAVAVDSTNKAYVVYSDSAQAGKATMKSSTGGGWSLVTSGSGFSSAALATVSPTIAINGSNVYTAFDVSTAASKVMQFDGSVWTTILSVPFAGYTTIAFNGSLYAAHTDGSGGPAYGIVKKYDGTSWTQVGSNATTSSTSWLSLAIGSAGKLYLAYSDGGSSSKASVMMYDPNINPPTATNLSISGNLSIGQTVTGNYTYFDSEGDTESGSTFKWYSATNSTCTAGKTTIGTAKTYTLTATELGKYVCFEVTPKTADGTLLTGTPALKTSTGVISANSPPTATGVGVSGITAVMMTVTGSYTYSDVDGDPQGTSTFKWYRADNSACTTGKTDTGITTKTYTVQSADLGKYLCFEVTPAAASGTSPGSAVTGISTATVNPAATVSINSVSNITGSTVFATATATGAGIGERGFYWWIPPSTATHFGGSESGLIPEGGSGAGSFSLRLTDLKPGNTYHIKAYIKVGGQIITSDEQIFTTATTGATGKMAPTVLTDTKNFTVSGSSITVNGEITDIGSSSVNVYGFVYAPHTAPFTGENMPATGDRAYAMWDQTPLYKGLKFTGTIKNIPPGKWYLRAYAHNVNPDSDAAQTASLGYGEDCSFTVACTPATCLPGDVNGDGRVDLTDAMLVLRILAGIPVGNVNLNADLNGDGKIGLAELGYILQKAAGLR